MADLVERLRTKHIDGVLEIDRQRLDAADEIVRLRKEVARLSNIRTAGNPYPYGSECFVAFEQARRLAYDIS